MESYKTDRNHQEMFSYGDVIVRFGSAWKKSAAKLIGTQHQVVGGEKSGWKFIKRELIEENKIADRSWNATLGMSTILVVLQSDSNGRYNGYTKILWEVSIKKDIFGLLVT